MLRSYSHKAEFPEYRFHEVKHFFDSYCELYNKLDSENWFGVSIKFYL